MESGAEECGCKTQKGKEIFLSVVKGSLEQKRTI
jgi:hypothetical protein